MTATKRLIPVLVFAFALPTAPLPAAAPDTAPGLAAESSPAPRPFIRHLRVRVWEPGAVAPNVSVNVPTFLVTAVIKTASITGLLDRALDEARRHDDADSRPGIHLRGREIDALWSALTGSGPASLVEVSDGAGGRVVIRVD